MAPLRCLTAFLALTLAAGSRVKPLQAHKLSSKLSELRAERAEKKPREVDGFAFVEFVAEEAGPEEHETEPAEAFSWGESVEDLYRKKEEDEEASTAVPADATWGCHAYSGSENDAWCKKGGTKDGYLTYRFFEKGSLCGDCQCCSTPMSDDSVYVATETVVEPSMVEQEAVVIKAGGGLQVRLFCKMDTNVSFTAFKLAPDEESDWVQIQTTGWNQGWNLGASKEWSWSSKSASLPAKQGENVVKIVARKEENMKIQQLSLTDIDGCYLGPEPKEDEPTPEPEATEPPAPAPVGVPVGPLPPADAPREPKDAATRTVTLSLAVVAGLILMTMRM